MPHILLITHWTGGDVFPFINMGKILIKNGFKVSILTHGIYKQQAEEAGLEFYPIDIINEYNELYDKMYLILDPFANLEQYISFFRKFHGKDRILREYNIMKEIITEDTLIIARHRSSISGLFAAEKFGCKAVSVFLAPNYLSHIDIHEELFGTITLEEYNSAREIIGLNKIDDLKKYYFSPQKIFGIWASWFASAENDWPKNIVALGFIPKELKKESDLPDEIKDFLKSDKKKVLITGGTSKFVKKDFYEIIQSGVNLVDCKAIMVVPFESQRPNKIADNVLMVSSACVSKLMYCVDAVIHHGGMGTLSEAISAGTPQIILSHIIDGRDNAFRLNEIGIAVNITVSRWNAENIKNALEYTLSGKMFEKCREIQYKYNNDKFEENLIIEVKKLFSGDDVISDESNNLNISNKVCEKKLVTDELRKKIISLLVSGKINK